MTAPTVSLSPIYSSSRQLDNNNEPLNNGKLYCYEAGSFSALQTAYTDVNAGTPLANPLTLSSSGQVPEIWLDVTKVYNLVITESDGTTVIQNSDNVGFSAGSVGVTAITAGTGIAVSSATGNVTISVSASAVAEWVPSTTPTFISTTSFSLAGNLISVYTVGRRVKTVNTGGIKYGTITNSVYGTNTVITVLLDAGGVLDTGLSIVYYGFISDQTAPAQFGFNPIALTVPITATPIVAIGGAPTNTIYLSTTTITETAMVVGNAYTIVTLDPTTSYVSYGADANVIGTSFICTVVGVGVGTVSSDVQLFDTVNPGVIREVIFINGMTVNNNAAIVLPGNDNIVVAPNDAMTFFSQGNHWFCTKYSPYSGLVNQNAPVSLAYSATPDIGAAQSQIINLAGQTGVGATVNVTVSGGIVTVCTLVGGGGGYVVGDVLTLANAFLGGIGSGFTITVGTVTSGVITTLITLVGGAGYGSASYTGLTLTGTQQITGFASDAAGIIKEVIFGGIVTLVYNATSFILPGNANLLTAIGDSASFLSLGSGNWRCLSYTVQNTTVQRQKLITATGSWQVPGGVTSFTIIGASGAGGGGAAGVNDGNGADGGGAGQPLATPIFVSCTPGTIYTATLGAGGAGHANTGVGGTGATGGTTSFSGPGLNFVTLAGGVGGANNGGGPEVPGTFFGGGAAGGALPYLNGRAGTDSGIGGDGGGPAGGKGVPNSAGNAGVANSGGGGSGGSSTLGNYYGGSAGATGYILIIW